ncbi:MAG TPA: heavy metal-associated domain-containing protein, partial [Planctomycetota bacterium]|nr:heavy metal-associated domain-containing protein [Planctomycetota bacterium]
TFGFFRVYSQPSTKRNRLLLWISAGVFLVVVATPYLATYVRDGMDDPTPDPPATRRLVVQLNDIEYASCCEGPAKETLGALPGVRRVRINHRQKEAILVVNQDAEIDNAMISDALRAVDYTGHLKTP